MITNSSIPTPTNKIILYLGLDVHKDSIVIAIASSDGEVRFYGTVGGKLADLDRALKKIQKAHPHAELRFCSEAGPTGYSLYRHLTQRKFHCIVVAPSKTPRKTGERVKTDRRDALTLARSFRAGDLIDGHPGHRPRTQSVSENANKSKRGVTEAAGGCSLDDSMVSRPQFVSSRNPDGVADP